METAKPEKYGRWRLEKWDRWRLENGDGGAWRMETAELRKWGQWKLKNGTAVGKWADGDGRAWKTGTVEPGNWKRWKLENGDGTSSKIRMVELAGRRNLANGESGAYKMGSVRLQNLICSTHPLLKEGKLELATATFREQAT